MSEQVSVSLEKLRIVFNLLIDHLRQEVGPEISFDKDYFWSIPKEALYNIYSEPTDLSIGQLGESLSNLESILTDSSKVMTYGLVWLADILKAAGLDVVR